MPAAGPRFPSQGRKGVKTGHDASVHRRVWYLKIEQERRGEERKGKEKEETRRCREQRKEGEKRGEEKEGRGDGRKGDRKF